MIRPSMILTATASGMILLSSFGPPSGGLHTRKPIDGHGDAKWTVMVFMNADNNLEADALENFKQMASLPNSPQVNVVVQFDRIAEGASTDPDWEQTLRFRIRKGIKALPGAALQDLGELDMGDTATLHDFVSWAKRQYPAQHYILIIWNHGQGWRFAPGAPNPSIEKGPYRSISTDDTNDGHTLYNRGIQDVLSGEGLDILGFDACLMAMLETAYAFREVADYMVASEDLIPGAGWQYDDWLGRLAANPSMTARELSAAIVASYRKTYEQTDPATTLSAMDLSKVSALVTSVTAFSDALLTLLPKSAAAIVDARTESYEYAPNHRGDGRNYFHHVDLGQFASRTAAHLSDPTLRRAAADVVHRINETVVANYAGSARMSEFGSTGVAIYFPISGTDYRNDPFEEGGYKKDNTFWPVAFVKDATWADFLNTYWQLVN